MTDSDELRHRAERAAATIIAQHDLTALGVPYGVLLPVIAVGWLEGWQAAGEEAVDVVRSSLAQYARAGLHSVKVTP